MMRSVNLLCLIGLLRPVLGKDRDKWLSPEYSHFYQFPLPIPPEIKPLTSYTDPGTGTPIDFYQMNISSFQAQIYPNLGKADLVGYNGISPGPTFRITRGRESVVRVVNQYDRASVLHLHGSYTRPVWDGWAEDLIEPGQYKDYYFPNTNSARTMWYHDHAVMTTAANAYSGQSGFYIVEDPAQEARLGLPQGKYDIPLALAAKQYTSKGNITDVSHETDSLYGDVIEVNGQPWPFLEVEARKYRFRILNTALSRTFMLGITSGEVKVPMQVVASDSGFMSSAVTTETLTVAMAERWEVIVDFADFGGQNLTVSNKRKVFADDDFAATDRVMQFNVGSKVSSTSNNGPVPSTLVPLDLPSASGEVDRKFKFSESHGKWLINGVPFEDVKNRILARPQRGNTEIWSLENHSSSWSHPIHIHMVDFQILSREKGRDRLETYEKPALKDVAVLGPDERVKVAIEFAPYEGVYMFHCHNLIHEDHAMMDAFNVTALKDFGYSETDLMLSDPMEEEWRARDFVAMDVDSIESEVLPRFAATGAYRNVTGLVGALDKYWLTHASGTSRVATKSLMWRTLPASIALNSAIWSMR